MEKMDQVVWHYLKLKLETTSGVELYNWRRIYQAFRTTQGL